MAEMELSSFQYSNFLAFSKPASTLSSTLVLSISKINSGFSGSLYHLKTEKPKSLIMSVGKKILEESEMEEVVIRVKIPDEFERLRVKIEEIIYREVEGIIKRLEDLRKTKGCLKTDKTWEELEAEMYDGLYEDFCR